MRTRLLLFAFASMTWLGTSLGCETQPAAGSPTSDPDAGADADGMAPADPTLLSGPGDVLTSKNDNGRTGANLAEVVIGPSNVRTLALTATLPVDGELYAQPLVVGDVATAAGSRSLVIAATMNDSVYAFDLDAPEGAPPIWHAGGAGELGRPGRAQRNVVGPNGILSTPVVDRARSVVWVVSRDCSETERTTFDRCGVPTEVPRCVERLSALALATGEVRATVVIEGSAWSPTKRVVFDPSVQWNRPALLLAGDALLVAFGSGPNANDHEEDYEYHGWLFRYDARSITTPPAVFNTTPRSSGGSIWQAGAGPAADGDHVYFVTANDILGCSTHAPSGFPPSPTDAEDSIVRVPLGYAATDLRETDAGVAPVESPFGSVGRYGDALVYSDTRPYTAAGITGNVFQFTNSGDSGFGSSGPTLIPGSRDLVVSSKGGLVYLLDRDTMMPRQAPLSPFDVLPLQGDHSLLIHSWWGIPMLPGALAFYRTAPSEGLLYGWPKEDKLRSFRYNYAAHTLAPDRAANVAGNNQGGYLSVTADGTRAETAIVWATTPRSDGGGRVLAFDALTLEELWHADTPAFSKFTPPTIARGRLIVPSAKYGVSSAVLVYAPSPASAGPYRSAGTPAVESRTRSRVSPEEPSTDESRTSAARAKPSFVRLGNVLIGELRARRARRVARSVETWRFMFRCACRSCFELSPMVLSEPNWPTMLQLRPSCECCDRDLPPDSPDARICSFECTFCVSCATAALKGICPNCGGELTPRPRRPASKLTANPPSTQRVFKPRGCAREAS